MWGNLPDSLADANTLPLCCLLQTITAPMRGATMLYDYPAHDLNVYADEDMTMEVAETPTSPWV